MGAIINEFVTITSDGDLIEKRRKEQEYLEYIKEHIAFVQEAFELYMRPLLNKNSICTTVSDEKLKEAILELEPLLDTHDASKFSDDEFDGYRLKWYPTKLESDLDENEKRIITDQYEKCWEHHYTVNDHHPKHWVNPETDVPEDMCLRAIIEMICDWEAMSLKFKTNTLEWYENKAKEEKAAMSVNTKVIVEDLMKVLHN